MTSSVPLAIAFTSALLAILFAQTTGIDTAIKAASESGYEAVVLVMIVLTVFGLFSWAVRGWIMQASAREDRLANRVTQLENVLTERLFTELGKAGSAIENNNAVLVTLSNALLTTRPCWWSAEKQGEVLAAAADRIAEHLIDLIERSVHERWKPVVCPANQTASAP